MRRNKDGLLLMADALRLTPHLPIDQQKIRFDDLTRILLKQTAVTASEKNLAALPASLEILEQSNFVALTDSDASGSHKTEAGSQWVHMPLDVRSWTKMAGNAYAVISSMDQSVQKDCLDIIDRIAQHPEQPLTTEAMIHNRTKTIDALNRNGKDNKSISREVEASLYS